MVCQPRWADAGHYAAAFIACANPSDALTCHFSLGLRPGEKLSGASARAEMTFLAAAAHGCQPEAAGRFWAIFGLLTSAEKSSYTGHPGVQDQLRRPLHESEAAACSCVPLWCAPRLSLELVRVQGTINVSWANRQVAPGSDVLSRDCQQPQLRMPAPPSRWSSDRRTTTAPPGRSRASTASSQTC